MRAISKNSKKILAERAAKGLGKCTVTPSQGHYISKSIKFDLANGRFKKTEDMKIQIIKYANEFYFANPDNSKKISALKKSTFYDLLGDFKIPTPLQYRKLNKQEFQSLELSNQTTDESEIYVKGTTTLFERHDGTTEASTNTGSYGTYYIDECLNQADIQFVENAESNTDHSDSTTVQSQNPVQYVQQVETFSFNSEGQTSFIPQNNFESNFANFAKSEHGMQGLVKSDSFGFFNKRSDETVRFSMFDFGMENGNSNFGLDSNHLQNRYLEPDNFISYRNVDYSDDGFIE
jgi:hypothetical protein